MSCAVVAFGGSAQAAPRANAAGLRSACRASASNSSDFPNFFNFQKVVFCLQKYNF